MDNSVIRLSSDGFNSFDSCFLLGILVVHLSLLTEYSSSATSLSSNQLFYVITEEQPAYQLVANLSRDLSLDLQYSHDVLSMISFVLISEAPSTGWFTLTPDGLITTSGVIDRDVTCRKRVTCDVIMQVALHPEQDFDEEFNVNISIADINDKAPIFIQSRANITISESTPIGTRFALPSAVDADSPSNGRVDYKLEFSNVFRLHKINNSILDVIELRLELLQVLDREERDHYELTLVSFDVDHSDLSSTLIIDVTILDANDNRPQFESSSYNVNVLETTPVGSVIATVSAIDHDLGLNGQIRYKMTSRSQAVYADRFQIDAESGDVVLLKSFDFATRNSYSISVAAEDLGIVPRSSVTSLHITVVDVNLYAPEITFDSLSLETVSRRNESSLSGLFFVNRTSQIGTLITRVTARDPDDMFHASVTCQLIYNDVISHDVKCLSNDVTCSSDEQHPIAYFQLAQIFDGEYKLVTINSLEDTTFLERSFVVSCADNGNPVQTSTRNITVKILDIRGLPVFTRTVYRAVLPLKLEINVAILQVQASAGKTSRDRIVYSLENSEVSDILRIDVNTGSIYNIVNLDFILVNSIIFNVTATVVNDPSRRSHAEVILTVPAEKKIAILPQFYNCIYSFEISELARPGTSVGRVFVSTDKEPYDRFEFYLSQQSSHFKVDPATGIIYSSAMLDRESRSDFELLVKVKDVNDEATQLDLLDGAAEQFPKTQRSERDVDTVIDDSNIYFVNNLQDLTENYDSEDLTHVPLNITQRNTLWIKDINCKSISGQLNASAETQNDDQLSDLAIVRIKILDANDNAPVVLFPPTGDGQVSVPSDLSPGRLVTSVIASDPDLGDNSQLSYSLVDSNGTRYFDLNETTGEIKLLAVLTHCVNESFRLVLSVQDNGTPRRQMSLVMLIITVKAVPETVFLVVDHKIPDEWFTNLTVGAKALSVAILATACVTIILLIAMAIYLIIRRRRRKYHGSRAGRKYADSSTTFDSIPLSIVQMSVGEMNNRTLPCSETSRIQNDIGTNDLDVVRSLVTKSDCFGLEKASTDQDSDSGCADVSNAGSHDEVAEDALDDGEGINKLYKRGNQKINDNYDGQGTSQNINEPWKDCEQCQPERNCHAHGHLYKKCPVTSIDNPHNVTQPLTPSLQHDDSKAFYFKPSNNINSCADITAINRHSPTKRDNIPSSKTSRIRTPIVYGLDRDNLDNDNCEKQPNSRRNAQRRVRFADTNEYLGYDPELQFCENERSLIPSSECELISDSCEYDRWHADEESTYIDGEPSRSAITHSPVGGGMSNTCFESDTGPSLSDVDNRGKIALRKQARLDSAARCQAGQGNNCEMAVNVKEPWGSVPRNTSNPNKRVILSTFLPENGSLV